MSDTEDWWSVRCQASGEPAAGRFWPNRAQRLHRHRRLRRCRSRSSRCLSSTTPPTTASTMHERVKSLLHAAAEGRPHAAALLSYGQMKCGDDIGGNLIALLALQQQHWWCCGAQLWMASNQLCITLRAFRDAVQVHDGEDATRTSFQTRGATRAGVQCSAIGNGIKVVHAVHAGNASWSLTSSQPPAASCSCTTSPAFACQYRMHVQRLHCAIARSIQRRTVLHRCCI